MARKESAAGKSALMTLQQVSAEKGPPYTTVRDLVIQGHLPRVALGDSKRIWVRRSDVERLMGGAA